MTDILDTKVPDGCTAMQLNRLVAEYGPYYMATSILLCRKEAQETLSKVMETVADALFSKELNEDENRHGYIFEKVVEPRGGAVEVSITHGMYGSEEDANKACDVFEAGVQLTLKSAIVPQSELDAL